MNKLRAILIDDERLARAKLRSMLAAYPQIAVVGEADSVRSAITLIESVNPEVLFLDIQMPGESGFHLLDQVDSSFQTIFVTAFDEFAIRAFEVNALDYLLKPVTHARLARSIERLVVGKRELDLAKRTFEYDDHIFLETEKQSRFVKVSAVKCLLASGPYSEILTADGQRILVLKSLKDWEDRLPAKHFLRIHRSTLINLEHIERVEKGFNYAYQIFLRGLPEPLVMSRRYATKLKDKLK